MSRSEVDACLEALPARATLMCGVLVSEKTLRGERNKWWRRYPRVEDIASIFSPDPRCLNLIHYASAEPPDERALAKLVAASATAGGGTSLHGFQFNVTWPSPERVYWLAGMRCVFQARQWFALDDAWALAHTLKEDQYGVHEHPDRNVTDVLLDYSGGHGSPLDSEALLALAAAVRVLRAAVPSVQVGIAGGLCAETLPAVAPLVREYALSIDAEGRLRDGDEGGVLNIDRAQAYVRAAGEIGAWS